MGRRPSKSQAEFAWGRDDLPAPASAAVASTEPSTKTVHLRRSYKFRLFPNANQTRELGIMLETHRRLYNECLSQRNLMHEVAGLYIDRYAQQEWFRRKSRSSPWYARLNAHSAEKTIERLDMAFSAFFRRCKAKEKPGYPRFKSRARFNAIPFKWSGGGVRLSGDKLRVQYVGSIRVKLHREIGGRIKTASLKREADKWYIVFSCDLGDVTVEQSPNPPVGVDMGIESFLTTSDGEHVANPGYLKAELPELRRRGRSVTRKKRGGKNRRKAAKRLRELYAKVKNKRKEHHHQASLSLIRRYGFIAVERLNVRGMLKNGRLSRAISDAGWTGFIETLRCKAESAGVAVVEVDPRWTSQECSECGETVAKALSVRVHNCPKCGLSLHRDVNAARNILARAGPARVAPAGLNVGHRAVRAPGSRRGDATWCDHYFVRGSDREPIFAVERGRYRTRAGWVTLEEAAEVGYELAGPAREER